MHDTDNHRYCRSVVLRANSNADVGAKYNGRMKPLIGVQHNYNIEHNSTNNNID